MRHEVNGERSAGRIVVGAQIAARLIHQPIDRPLGVNRLPIHADFVLVRLQFAAQLAHRLAVDADPAGGNQFLALSPRADAGMSQYLVQALFHELIVR